MKDAALVFWEVIAHLCRVSALDLAVDAMRSVEFVSAPIVRLPPTNHLSIRKLRSKAPPPWRGRGWGEGETPEISTTLNPAQPVLSIPINP